MRADWVITSHFDVPSGHEAGLKLHSGPDRPTAVFSVNDFLAIGLMGAARACNLVTGSDLAVVGFNDTALAAQLPIPGCSHQFRLQTELTSSPFRGTAPGSS
ncbi:MAG: substrate-binding domain-containing protein [Pseudomonas fluorescens]|nr:substrate-binding domain-containing protein [Pseudomonas fluorescens]